MDLKKVQDDERLFRGVPGQPSFIKADGSITSAAVKDRHGGVSVDRDGGRSDAEVINFFCKTQRALGKNILFQKFLKLKTFDVRSSGCEVSPKPLDVNPFHAEITQNGIGELKRSVAKKIIDLAEVINNSVN